MDAILEGIEAVVSLKSIDYQKSGDCHRRPNQYFHHCTHSIISSIHKRHAMLHRVHRHQNFDQCW